MVGETRRKELNCVISHPSEKEREQILIIYFVRFYFKIKKENVQRSHSVQNKTRTRQ